MIQRTTDGGRTWTVQAGVSPALLFGASLTDANRGTVVGWGLDFECWCGYGLILRTADGGATWSLEDSGLDGGLYGVSFVDANTGTVVGDGGAILRTNTGGQ